MKFLNDLINWFNGKKTTIAAVLMFLASFLMEVVVGKFGATAAWIQPTVDTLLWFGMVLGGVGLAHKAIKAGNE
jgi:hypothetical protein